MQTNNKTTPVATDHNQNTLVENPDGTMTLTTKEGVVMHIDVLESDVARVTVNDQTATFETTGEQRPARDPEPVVTDRDNGKIVKNADGTMTVTTKDGIVANVEILGSGAIRVRIDDQTVMLEEEERKPADIYTRVMGYIQMLSRFNTGKRGEQRQRTPFSVDPNMLVDDETASVMAQSLEEPLPE